jgi:hypothetical protein
MVIFHDLVAKAVVHLRGRLDEAGPESRIPFCQKPNAYSYYCGVLLMLNLSAVTTSGLSSCSKGYGQGGLPTYMAVILRTVTTIHSIFIVYNVISSKYLSLRHPSSKLKQIFLAGAHISKVTSNDADKA